MSWCFLFGRDQRQLIQTLEAENETLRVERDALRDENRQLLDADLVQRELIRALRAVNTSLDERLVERDTSSVLPRN